MRVKDNIVLFVIEAINKKYQEEDIRLFLNERFEQNKEYLEILDNILESIKIERKKEENVYENNIE